MNSNSNINNIIIGLLLIGITECLFFSLLFSTKREKKLSDKIIGIWLLILAVQIIFIAITFKEQLINQIYKQVQVSILMLHGPFLFLYSNKLTTENSTFKLNNFLHFSPFVIHIAIAFLFYLSKTKTNIFIKETALFGILSGLIYNLLVLYRLIKHKKQIKNKFSFTEKINLNWLLQLAIGLFIIWIVGSVTGFMVRFLNYQIHITWLFTFVPLFVFYLGFYGIKQQIIYPVEKTISETNQQQKFKKPKLPTVQIQPKYKKSSLQTQDMEKINVCICKITASQQLYLNPALTLADLSEKTKIPAHHITQTLNEHCKQNFHDFINQYRINEFKNQVLLPKNNSFSLLGIAFDCGFNSKSSFNRIFKKLTSQTPSEYKKNNTHQ